MTTWASFRDNFLRNLTNDTGSTEYVDDATLLVYANQAIYILSEEVGLDAYDDLIGTGPAFDLPSDFMKVKLLEMTYSDEIEYLSEIEVRPGDTRRNTTSTRPNNFLINWPEHGKLTLFSTPDTDYSYRLHYQASFAAITAEGDLPFENINWLELALGMYTGFLIFTGEASGRARLGQWSTAPELKVGNPLEIQADWFHKQFYALITRHKA